MYSIAIFGGTFDPVHNGHICTSLAIQKEFQFDSYHFIPCKMPVIKPKSTATTEQRIDMLNLALSDYQQFEVDLREINRATPSYMVETLESIRNEHQSASINLILGFDAFLSLPKWHQWGKIIELTNLLVINRKTFTIELPRALKELLQIHQVTDKTQLLNKPAGAIYLFNAGDYEISSTQIRTALKEQRNISQLIPDKVYQYIKQKGLYL